MAPMTPETSMAGYYAARAAEYERIYHKPERQSDLARLRERVASAFAGKRVLEVACGTGYWTQVLNDSAESVVATDLNEEVLAIARATPIDAAKVSFQRADAYALDTKSGGFSGGLAGFWWSHVPKARLRDFLTQFHRVLEPGAKVMFIDNRYVEGSSTPLSRTDELGNTFQERKLTDGSTHEVLKNFPTETELRASVRDLASEVHVEFYPYFWILTYTPR